jgi:hypothetical protein
MAAEPNADLLWLRKQIPKDCLGILDDRAKRLVAIIKGLHDADSLPHTIGLFGTWGAGKTSTLAYLETELTKAGLTSIYFNAYKYAGYMEVVPALIYRLISETPLSKNEKSREQLIGIISALSGKYADRFGKWLETKTGINPIEVAKDLRDAKELIDEPSKERLALLEQYYTRIDRAQDTLKTIFDQSGGQNPTIVLIDELDRCDPGEAFESMKQLRILFNMRKLPIVFVLVANPFPIAAAIKHQFGLSGEAGEYEAASILEKFVDTYIDLAEPVSLAAYVKGLWERHLPNRLEKSSFIIALDGRTVRAPDQTYLNGTLTNGTALEWISSANPFYANLRALDKTLAFTAAYHASEAHLWTIWHLTMLRQWDPELRLLIAKTTHELKIVIERTLLSTLRTLRDQGQIVDRKIKQPLSLGNFERHSPFAIYYTSFWQNMHQRGDELANTAANEQSVLLGKIKSSVPRMNVLISTSLMALNNSGIDKLVIVNPDAGSLADAIERFDGGLLANLGWLLSVA